MAREYARLMVSIWDDKDYQSLDPYFQGVFNALMAYPTISWCGVIDYIPKRLTRFSDAVGPAELGSAIEVLEAHRMVVLDEDTDELLLRTFIRHDGVLKMKNVGKAMVSAFERVQSLYLRDVIVSELAKLWDEAPTMKGWEGVEEMATGLFEEVQEYASRNPSGKGSAKGSGEGS